jgi:hypothetical protein
MNKGHAKDGKRHKTKKKKQQAPAGQATQGNTDITRPLRRLKLPFFQAICRPNSVYGRPLLLRMCGCVCQPSEEL